MRIVRLLRCLPPQLPGRLRLAAFLLRPLFDLTGIKIEDRYGFSYNVPSIKESIGLHLLVFGIYEPLLMECLLHYIKPGFTFVDVGANIGYYSIIFGLGPIVYRQNASMAWMRAGFNSP